MSAETQELQARHTLSPGTGLRLGDPPRKRGVEQRLRLGASRDVRPRRLKSCSVPQSVLVGDGYTPGLFSMTTQGATST